MGASLTGVLDTYNAASNTLLSGLQAVWELNEISGQAQDELGVYDATSTSVQYDASGKIGRCFTYTGAHSVTIGDVLHLTSHFTVSCWLKTNNGASDFYAIVGNFGSVNNFGYDVVAYTGGTPYLEFGVRSSGHTAAITATYANLCNSNWHHIVVLWDGAQRKIYVDNVKISATDDWTYAPSSSEDSLYIGDRGSCNPWIGSLDAVRIWNRDLTEAEINTLYTAENAGTGYPW